MCHCLAKSDMVGCQLKLKLEQKRNYGKKSPFPGFDCVRKEKEKEESQGFLPRSTEFRWSVFVRPRTKVHRIDEGYA